MIHTLNDYVKGNFPKTFVWDGLILHEKSSSVRITMSNWFTEVSLRNSSVGLHERERERDGKRS